MQKLLTQKHLKQLLRNGEPVRATGDGSQHYPVVKLFSPFRNCTWLISEIDPDDDDRAFGLCDSGQGCPELGYISLSELRSVKIHGLSIERDRSFKADKTLAEYTEAAQTAGRIIT